jgi:DNA-binding NarL/FixJ family response regulator
VVVLLCAGRSNKEIAAELGKGEPTVANQVLGCLQKFSVRSRTRLVARLHALAALGWAEPRVAFLRASTG